LPEYEAADLMSYLKTLAGQLGTSSNPKSAIISPDDLLRLLKLITMKGGNRSHYSLHYYSNTILGCRIQYKRSRFKHKFLQV